MGRGTIEKGSVTKTSKGGLIRCQLGGPVRERATWNEVDGPGGAHGTNKADQ